MTHIDDPGDRLIKASLRKAYPVARQSACSDHFDRLLTRLEAVVATARQDMQTEQREHPGTAPVFPA